MNLNPETEAIITDCYIDAELQSQPTLISMNTAKLSIQNSLFTQFQSSDGSAIILGGSYVSIHLKNTVFENNNGLHGIIHMYNGGTFTSKDKLLQQCGT